MVVVTLGLGCFRRLCACLLVRCLYAYMGADLGDPGVKVFSAEETVFDADLDGRPWRAAVS